jgi:hypothetical protein
MAPPLQGNACPDKLDYAKWPRALQEPVGRRGEAGSPKGQDEDGSALFERIEQQHRSDRDNAEQGETVHLFD